MSDEERRALTARVQDIMDYKMISCGIPWHFKDHVIDWEFNPTYNGYKEWPWQLSRHDEFLQLALYYALTGDENAARTYAEMLGSWLRQAVVPVDLPHNATWCWRTIEAGIRMTLNWHYAFYACIHSPYMTDHVITTFIRSICDHGYRLRNFGSGGGNWRAMEMAGLAHIAILFPFLREADEWRERAFSVLEVELESEDTPLTLPPYITVLREVTGEKAYKNRALAAHIPEED